MGLWKYIGMLTMMNAKTPGELATGAILTGSDYEKEKKKRERKSSNSSETIVEWYQCANCGLEINQGDSYCQNCGVQLKKCAPINKLNTDLKFTFYDSDNNVITWDKISMIKAGFYKVDDRKLFAGEYMFFSPHGNGHVSIGMGEVEKKDLLPDYETNKNRCLNNMFIKLKYGDVIYFDDGFLISTLDFYKFSFNYIRGISDYRIGIDIPEGNYILYPVNNKYLSSFSINNNFFEIGFESSAPIYIEEEKQLYLNKGIILTLNHNCNYRIAESVVMETKGGSTKVNKNINEFFKNQDINFEVLESHNDTYGDGSSGTTLFFSISNQTLKSIDLEYNSISIVGKNREEKDFTCWLEGHFPAKIGAGNIKKGAVIFEEFDDSDTFQFSIDFNDNVNSKEYNLLFIRNDNKKWEFSIGEVVDLNNVKKDSEMLAERIKDNIERIEPFEEELGITLENISINIRSDFNSIKVLGEIVSTNQEKTKDKFSLYVNFYNNKNELMHQSHVGLYGFKGYDSFSIVEYNSELNIKEIEKIRIFVKE